MLRVDHPVETRRQSPLKQTEEPEPQPEPKERTMRVLMLAESRGFTKAGIRMFEDADSKEQRAATTVQGIVRKRACYEEIVKDKMRLRGVAIK